MPGAALVEVISRRDLGQDLSGRVIDRQDGNRDIRPECAGAAARQVFQALLPEGVDAELLDTRVRRTSHRFLGGDRSQHWHGDTSDRHRLSLGVLDITCGQQTGHAVEHAIAGGARDLRRTIRTTCFRRLGESNQQCRFTEREPARLLAEIRERGRTHAFEIAAKRRGSEIEREHLVFAQRALDLDCAHHLAQLAEQGARARLEQARDLHGERRGAGHVVAVQDELPARAQQRERVHARMLTKAPVLIGEQHIEVARINVIGARRQAPAPVSGRKRAQQPPVPINNKCRVREVLAERRRSERDDERGHKTSYNNNAHRSGACDQSQAPLRNGRVPSPLVG